MNLPNKLTLLRIALILPFLLVLYLERSCSSRASYTSGMGTSSSTGTSAAVTYWEPMDFQTHLYRSGEMEELLRELGFSHVAAYGSFQKEPAVRSAWTAFAPGTFRFSSSSISPDRSTPLIS